MNKIRNFWLIADQFITVKPIRSRQAIVSVDKKGVMSSPQHLIPVTIEVVQRALGVPLPGVAGQKKMAPQPRTDDVDRFVQPDDCWEAGVLLLLYPHKLSADGDEPELHLVLTRRSEYPGVHSGQISFPGGRREGYESLQDTALRETMEEVGVSPETINVIGRLSSLYTPPSNFCIYPFVAFSPIRPGFRPDPQEVAELLEIPVSLLLNPTARKEEIWHFEKYGPRHIPFFDVYGHKVWGATAMVLSEFVTLLTDYLSMRVVG